MTKRYPRTLSSGANNTVIALSETEVGKLFTGDTRSDIGSEAEKMKFAVKTHPLCFRAIPNRIKKGVNLPQDLLLFSLIIKCKLP